MYAYIMLLLIIRKCGYGFGGRKIFILNEQQIVLNPVTGLWWLLFACVRLVIGVILLWGEGKIEPLHLCLNPKLQSQVGQDML